MGFWKRATKRSGAASATPETGQVQAPRTGGHRAPLQPLEVKLLAIEALENGLGRGEVAPLVGVTPSALSAWHKCYREGGGSAPSRQASSIAMRKQCGKLEERILAHRQEHPEHGVRRIRDDLRRSEALAVSAEKVRISIAVRSPLVDWGRGEQSGARRENLLLRGPRLPRRRAPAESRAAA